MGEGCDEELGGGNVEVSIEDLGCARLRLRFETALEVFLGEKSGAMSAFLEQTEVAQGGFGEGLRGRGPSLAG